MRMFWNRVTSNGACNDRESLEYICFAHVELNSRDLRQWNELMALILAHRNVFPSLRKFMALLHPSRFDETFNSESGEHQLSPKCQQLDWRFAKTAQIRAST